MQITGTVRAFVLNEIEMEYGLNLMPDFEVGVEQNKPGLV